MKWCDVMNDKKPVKPIDYLNIPIFSTYPAQYGIRATRDMFDTSNIVILRWYDETSRQHEVFVMKPDAFDGDTNYYQVEDRVWKY